jgi:fumarate reductase (CoM/CoB) subunit A
MRADDVVDCHVLVIGSGGSGVRAAIEAARYGDTLLVSKTIAGKGGCTTMAEGGYNAVLREEDSCDIHYEDTLKGGAYLNDRDLVKILVQEAPQRIKDLIHWGAVFDFTNECEIAQRPFGGQRFPRTCYAGDRTGHEMMMTLMERFDSSGATKLEEVTVIDLLKQDDSVIGAIALDENGEIFIITADSTILATGGGARVYDISTNSSSGTGDGFAMGYRAGAELIDMEMVQFHPTGAVYPYDARGRLITEAVRGEGGILKNILGERFMGKYDPARKELSTRDVVSRAIATEIANGRGTPHGGVFLDVTHLPKEQIETRLPVMLEQFLTFGLDIRTQAMEVAPTAHHIMGGLRITSNCETTVPGLFACGETAGGVQGANRLGGNALAETQVFGKRAGEFAGQKRKRVKKINAAQVSHVQKCINNFFSGRENPARIRKELQCAMWQGAGIFRDEAGLRQALTTAEHLLQSPLKAVGPSGPAECCTIRNMCLTSVIICRSALIRPESRGADMRVDLVQDWDAENSPFGHTYISREREGIIKHGATS